MAITRSVYNAPGQNVNRDVHTWDYAFEADNGIKQAASGEMKQIGEDEVVVMRGSYQYIGADGEVFIKKTTASAFSTERNLVLISKLKLHLFI